MESPLIHLRFNEKWIDDASAEDVFEAIANEARSKGVLVHASIYLPQEFGISDKADPRPSLRTVVTRKHTKQQLSKAAEVIRTLLIDALDKKTHFGDDGLDEEKQEE